jgi:hypothetical protein
MPTLHHRRDPTSSGRRALQCFFEEAWEINYGISPDHRDLVAIPFEIEGMSVTARFEARQHTHQIRGSNAYGLSERRVIQRHCPG